MSQNETEHRCSNGDEQCPVWQELITLRARVKKLENDVHRDELTGLHNRRHFNYAVNQELERTRRTGHPTSLILLDIDHFKRVNDDYGHPIGDLAIQHVANAIMHDLRRLDIACRYGGEEYAIILPSTPMNTAIAVAGRLRQQIVGVPIILPQGRQLSLSASLGVSTANFQDKEVTARALVMQADKALYKAKNKGRNCVVAHVPFPQTSLDTSLDTAD
ncbi:GGDEF domain-containing protein [Marinagarivorans algicola]|uniref:GGDEF domain-containing protein n=1 Tax=Marinagarivorans algicola TaxID=1513270 RepID=UPI0006B8E143|nr:GGDEF domain-containing protein [Marinagarivorans algicola]